MDPTSAVLFEIAQKRLAYLAERQNVLASNIANANTPNFHGADLQPFAAVLHGLSSVQPSLTQHGHMSGTLPSLAASVKHDKMMGRAVDGNSVVMDQQLTKVSDTESAQNLVATIWRKYVGMFNIALGRAS
jgi:flagellar basal-body rod protein FlgB